jgi:hypothetical protein
MIIMKGSKMSDTFKILAIIALVAFLVIFGPFVWIWCINTLFPIANIQYTFDTWLASLLIGGSFGGVRFARKSK